MSSRQPYNKRSRNEQPAFASTEGPQPRKIRNITSEADRAELERHYTFVPPESKTWQDRMVAHYHSHLYKEYVLADLRRPGQVGLRWRTEQEVTAGRGKITCGNKHCPGGPSESASSLSSYYKSSLPANEDEELRLLAKVPHGLGLHDYEVPFTYNEHGVSKTELVKLRLCLQCAPLLFQKRGGGALEARKVRADVSSAVHNGGAEEASSKDDGNSSVPEPTEKSTTRKRRDSEASDDDNSRTRHRHSKHKKRKKRRK